MSDLIGQIPASWIPLITRVLVAVIIIVFALFVHGAAKRWLEVFAQHRGLAGSVKSLIRIVIRWTILLLTVLLVAHQFGVLANVWAAFAAVLTLVAIGFVAVWSILSNLLATVLVLLFRPFSVGDNVELIPENVGGKVIDLNGLFTTLRAEDGSLIQLPNNLFFQKILRRREASEPPVALGDQLEKDGPTE